MIQSRMALILPAVGSLMLVLLFFFLHILYYFLVGVFSIASCVGVTYVTLPLTELVVRKLNFLPAEWRFAQ